MDILEFETHKVLKDNLIHLLTSKSEFDLAEIISRSQLSFREERKGNFWNEDGVDYKWARVQFRANGKDYHALNSAFDSGEKVLFESLNVVLMSLGYFHIHHKPTINYLPVSISFDCADKVHEWNGCYFRSPAEFLLAIALEEENISFISNGRGRFGKEESRKTFEPDFVVFHNHQVLAVEVDGKKYHPDSDKNNLIERDLNLLSAKFDKIVHLSAKKCLENPKQAVQELLTRLVT
ncbi:hypothetical protein RGL53_004608 [Vibrio parahaemolyticus]|nr:hypothetical protein [Vibrio parahaemolyticus]